MADEAVDSKVQKKQIAEEKKRLKQEEKKQKQEIKKRAKEISKREAELDDEEDTGSKVSSALVTLIIVVVWIAILCFLVKMDVGGFGSEILTPLLKDVPVVNKILPGVESHDAEEEALGGYSSLKDAVDYIKVLELELEHEQIVNNTNQDELTALQAEVERLKEFEAMQVEFQRIKEQFYEEVIYSEKGPGAEEYRKFYEAMDPTTAEALYKQVILKLEEDGKVKDYVATYSAMKPKQAAAIFESMSDDLNLVADILMAMDSDTRGGIMGVMDSDIAAKVSKIMYPDS